MSDPQQRKGGWKPPERFKNRCLVRQLEGRKQMEKLFQHKAYICYNCMYLNVFIAEVHLHVQDIVLNKIKKEEIKILNKT